MMPKIEIWFEFASTYSYLSVARAERLLHSQKVDFVWKPFLLGPIFSSKGLKSSPFVLDSAKGDYMWRDMERRAAKHGLEFSKPQVFPGNGLRAARIMIAALNEPWCGNFARAVFAAQFAKGEDISSPTVLSDALEQCGVDSARWIASANSEDSKSQLRKTTELAQEFGIFGAPSFLVQGELFWGDDRFEDAIEWAKSTESKKPV